MRVTIAQTFDQCYTVDPVTGCHVWQRACKGKEVASGGGYGCLRIHGKLIGAHVFAWERANGPVPKGMQLLHSCDNTKCVNVAHMALGTNDENQADKSRRLRGPRKRTPEDIEFIRFVVSEGALQREAAVVFGIRQGDVSAIVNRKYWRFHA